MQTIFLCFPDYAAYQMAMLQQVEGVDENGLYVRFVHRWPEHEMAVDVAGQNYWTLDDGSREEKPGWLVNVRMVQGGPLPDDLKPYAREERPANPKVDFS